MAKQTILVGTSANDGTGDTLRAAAQKMNSNFTELYGAAEGAFAKANTLIDQHGTYVNVVSTDAVQLQYDPSGRADFSVIANGSWLYVNSEGLVWQSNTTGTTYSTAFGNDGSITLNGGTLLSSEENNLSITSNPNKDTSVQLLSTGNTITDGIYLTSYDGPTRIITSSSLEWKFDANGKITFPDGTQQNTAFKFASTIPTHSTGQAGDKLGTFAANSTYLYYCTTNWVEAEGFDPQPNIWKRIAWSANTW